VRTAAEGLRAVVLLKRIRYRLGGLVGGFLPRQVIAELESAAEADDLDVRLLHSIGAHVQGQLHQLDVPRIVMEERTILANDWSDEGRRLWIAPGDEVITAVFRQLGGEYAKPRDTVRIASHMTAEEIQPEMVELIRRATGLIPR
jgi:hypothetical protein